MARYICAWCGKYLNEIVFEGKDSHGICDPCRREVEKEFVKVKEYNDSVAKGKQVTIQNGGSQVRKV
jgi:hypothetical protein